MPTNNQELEWIIIRLGKDLNWWVQDTSEKFSWACDGLGIINPKQIDYIIDLCEPLGEYGFEMEILNAAFYKFRIDKESKGGYVRLVQVKEFLLESDEPLFALPEIVDEEKGPYVDFLKELTKLRVNMLNDLINFKHPLTADQLEEELREQEDQGYLEGSGIHFFNEITSILEYVPEGYELDMEDKADFAYEEKDELEAFSDVVEEAEEKIEEDETMKWDEEEEVEMAKPRRGRPPKK